MPLFPPQWYRNIRGANRRGTRANQPLATDVLEGTQYYVTDELVTERSNGTVWQDISDSGGGASGITELTGDVVAGPGTGAQAATIANDAVTFVKFQNIATDRLLGRDTAGSGNVEEIGLAASELEFDGAGNVQLVDTAVTPGTYGDATNVAQITVDSKGRITAASDVPISASGGGAWTLLDTLVASASGSLDFTGITSAHDVYKFILVNLIPGNPAADLHFLVSTDGGSTFVAGTDYEYISIANATSNPGFGAINNDNIGFILLFPDVDDSQSFGVCGEVILFDPLGSNFKTVNFDINAPFQPVARRYMNKGSGFWLNATAVDAIRFIYPTDTIDSGTIYCLGLNK